VVVEITIYRLSTMIGNEVTPNYYDEAVFLRVSGFVQQILEADPAELGRLRQALYARDEHINSIKNLVPERFNRDLFF
jgi:hypothetical protein